MKKKVGRKAVSPFITFKDKTLALKIDNGARKLTKAEGTRISKVEFLRRAVGNYNPAA